MTTTIIVDSDMLYAHMAPSDDSSQRTFLNLLTGQLETVQDEVGHDRNWIELPRPTSDDLYRWFDEFLAKKGHPSFYSHNIDLWKRELATRQDTEEWDRFERDRRLAFAKTSTANHGIELTEG